MAMPRELIRWLQTLDLPFAVKHPKRDLCNGYMVAEICSRYWKDVDLRQFDNGTSSKTKQSNWSLLTTMFAKHDAPLPGTLVNEVVNAVEGAANSLLEALYSLLTGRQLAVVPPAIEPEVAQVPQFNRNLGAAQQQLVDAMLKEAQLQAQEESRRQREQADEARNREAQDKLAAQRRAQEAASRKPKMAATQKVQAIRPVTADEVASADSGAAAAPVTFAPVTVKALAPQALSRLGYAANSGGRSGSAGASRKSFDGGATGRGGPGGVAGISEGVLHRISQTVEQIVSELTFASWPISPGSNYFEYLAMNASKVSPTLRGAIWDKLLSTQVEDIADWLLARPNEAGVFVATCCSAASTAAVQLLLGRAHFPFVGNDADNADRFANAVLESIARKNPLHAANILTKFVVPLFTPSSFVMSTPLARRSRAIASVCSLLTRSSAEALDGSALRAVQSITTTALNGSNASDPEMHAGAILTLQAFAAALPRLHQVLLEQMAARAAEARANSERNKLDAYDDDLNEDEDDPGQSDPSAVRAHYGAAATASSSSAALLGSPTAFALSSALTRELLGRATAALFHTSATIRLAALRLLITVVDHGSDDELDCTMLLQQLHPIAPQTLGAHATTHAAVVAPLAVLAGTLLRRCAQQVDELVNAIDRAASQPAADEGPFGSALETHEEEMQRKASSLRQVIGALEKILTHVCANPQKASATYTPLVLRCNSKEKLVIADVVSKSLRFVSPPVASTLATNAVALLLTLAPTERAQWWSRPSADSDPLTTFDPHTWHALPLAAAVCAQLAAQPLFAATPPGVPSQPNPQSTFFNRTRGVELLEILAHVTLRPQANMSADADEVPRWWDTIKVVSAELLRAAAHTIVTKTAAPSPAAAASGANAPAPPTVLLSTDAPERALQIYSQLARRIIYRCYFDLSGGITATIAGSLLVGESAAASSVVLPSACVATIAAAAGDADGEAAATVLVQPGESPLTVEGQQKAMAWWKTVVADSQ